MLKINLANPKIRSGSQRPGFAAGTDQYGDGSDFPLDHVSRQQSVNLGCGSEGPQGLSTHMQHRLEDGPPRTSREGLDLSVYRSRSPADKSSG
jgi:hypothetical protein